MNAAVTAGFTENGLFSLGYDCVGTLDFLSDGSWRYEEHFEQADWDIV